MQIEVSAPRPTALRCAYCHDDLCASAADRCSGCGAVLHPDCAQALPACPVLGCPGALQSSTGRVARRRWISGGLLAPLLGLIGGALLGLPVLAVLYFLLALWLRLPDGETLGSIVAMFGLPLLAAFAARWLLPRFRALVLVLGFVGGFSAAVLGWVTYFLLAFPG